MRRWQRLSLTWLPLPRGIGAGSAAVVNTGGVLDAEESVGELMGILWLFGDEAKNGNRLALDGYERPVNGRLEASTVSANMGETAAAER